MVDTCQGCSLKITHTQTRLSCCSSACSNKYHGHCVNVNSNDLLYLKEKNREWICPSCSKSKKHSRSESPSHSMSGDGAQYTNILTDLTKIETDNASLSSQISKLQTTQELIARILERIENSQATIRQNVVDLENTQSVHF